MGTTKQIILKAGTTSDWDNCNFAIIQCTEEWIESLQKRRHDVKLLQDSKGFVSISYSDLSIEFYYMNETKLGEILEGKDWDFIELKDIPIESYIKTETDLLIYRMILSDYITVRYSAFGKYSDDEFYTVELPVLEILNTYELFDN